MRFDYRRALTVLAAHEVECIVVGGISAVLPTLRATLAEIERARRG